MRHGTTEWSRTGRHTGLTDIALTAAGEQAAPEAPGPRGVGRYPADQSFDRVWTSPLARAAATCRLAGRGDEAVVHDDLGRVELGSYEGRTTHEIVEDRPGWQVWTHGAPGGESVDDVQRRVDGIVARLLDDPGRTLVFAHGHLLRALPAAWIELPVTEGRRLLVA